jgi:hypothetical protein
MRRLKFAPVVAAVLLLLTASSALADGNGAQTFTEHFTGTETSADVNPCTGEPGTVTTTFSGVAHSTLLANGTYHGTFTATGTFVFDTTDPALPDYTGRITVWGGENSNNQNFAGSFTQTIHGVGTDGSRVKFHQTAHFSVSASGVLVTFDKLHCA